MGQLGHGDCLRQTQPIKVASFSETQIVQISCGKRHTAAVSANGSLFTWGSNEYGQLGRQQINVKLMIRKQISGLASGMGSGSSSNEKYPNFSLSTKASPSMDLIQTQFHSLNHKIPLSTEHQQTTQHKFEFPKALSGNSEDDFDLHNLKVSG